MTLEATAQHLCGWLLSGNNHASFSVSHFLRSHELGQMIEQTLGKDLSTKIRYLVYPTNNIVHKPQSAEYSEYSGQEIRAIGNHVGHSILETLDLRLKPARLEQSKTKLEDLYALFLAMLSLSIAARYNFLHVSAPDQHPSDQPIRETGYPGRN